MSTTIDVMNDKLQLDLDAIVAYDEAIAACENIEVRARLDEFRGDHERHVEDLSENGGPLWRRTEADPGLQGLRDRGFYEGC